MAVKLWKHAPAKAKPFLEQSQRLGATAMKEVRKSVSALREHRRDDQPLEEAIAFLVEDVRQGTGICICTSICLDTSLSPQIVKTLYRIVQEALTNICKYAQATEIQIQLHTISDDLHLMVEDKGKGFIRFQSPAGFGLQGMRERVAALRGDFHLETEPGAGCRIVVKLPLIKLADDSR